MRQQVREGGKLLSFPGLSSLRIGTHKKPHFQTEYTAHIKPVAPERAHTLYLAVLVGLCTLSQYPAPTPATDTSRVWVHIPSPSNRLDFSCLAAQHLKDATRMARLSRHLYLQLSPVASLSPSPKPRTPQTVL